MICPCRQKSRPQFKQNSHLDEQMGNLPMELLKEAMSYGKFSWKVNMADGKKAAMKGTKKVKVQIVV